MNKCFYIQFLIMVTSLTSYISLSESERPNIVWIIAEDLSQDLGVYGNELVNTPIIDQLARRGVRYTNVFTTAGVCTPSRTALATGMYQTSIGAHHMGYPDELKPELPDSVQTIHQLFRKNGYVTASIKDKPATGKTHWAFKADMKANFDYNHWDNMLSQDKPFFAQISISNTHRPFPKVKSDESILEEIKIPPYYPDNIVVRKDFAGYYKSVDILDDKIGQILNLLRENDVEKNTIVFFFSDHGQPMPRGKYWHYDSSIRIPMIIHIPEAIKSSNEYNPGDTENQLISYIDITATTLSLAGIEKPNFMQGRIFWGANKEPEREYVFSASNRISELHFNSRAVRGHRYKYIRNYHHDFSINSASTAYRKANHPIYHVLNIKHGEGTLTHEQEQLVQPLPEEELYDLSNDPNEMINLISDQSYQIQLQILRDELDEWIRSTEDKGMGLDSEEVISAFSKFGEESYKRYQNRIQKLFEKVQAQLK